MKQFVVIGASRGLGASIVEELLVLGYEVVGISRTLSSEIPDFGRWSEKGKYRHIVQDISSSDCLKGLENLCQKLSPEPVCVIFNAALVESDVKQDSKVDFEVHQAVNCVQIEGFANTLKIFQDHLLEHGGILVGISSFSAITPPISEPRLAYPASKAYLDMALRSLRIIWKGRVKALTIHLGHLGGSQASFFPRWLVASYPETARKIVHTIISDSVPDEINYPFLYCLTYKYILKFIPDFLYQASFLALKKILCVKK